MSLRGARPEGQQLAERTAQAGTSGSRAGTPPGSLALRHTQGAVTELHFLSLLKNKTKPESLFHGIFGFPPTLLCLIFFVVVFSL